MKHLAKAAAVLALGLLAACGSAPVDTDPASVVSRGPDEFAVLPVKPLEIPENLNALPVPGGTNLADPDPRGDALRALGGRPVAAGAVPASDAALVTAASRFGVPQDVRALVAAEDARTLRRATRARIGLFTRTNPYLRAYARQSLDAFAEVERFRAAGAATPTSPPTAR